MCVPECLQRAVEGKAASDEDEDHRDTAEEKGRHLLDTKRHCTRTHSCGKGCPDRARHRGTSLNQDNTEAKAPDKTPQSVDRLQRMSSLEEKLRDALSLLLQLRKKNVSSRALGRIVLDTLDLCCRSGDGPPQVLHVAEALCARLSTSELFTDREGDSETEKRLPLVARQSNSTSSLLISC
ncbi:unnamed protein product [Knipowitschia caucasica]|uniref:Uncharacterized protein n=1 Tax=Knipowitschia caucasica TaxID=637954 RepID=A0AAV2M3F7_KNICA